MRLQNTLEESSLQQREGGLSTSSTRNRYALLDGMSATESGLHINFRMNFRLSVDFSQLDPNCNFSIGVGSDFNWEADYHLALSYYLTAFKKTGETIRQTEFAVPTNSGASTLIFERQDGSVKVSSQQQTLFEVESSDPLMNEINDHSMLFLYAAGAEVCSVTIERLILDAPEE